MTRLTTTIFAVIAAITILNTSCQKSEDIELETIAEQEVTQWEQPIPVSEHYNTRLQSPFTEENYAKDLSDKEIETACRDFLTSIKAYENGNKAAVSPQLPQDFVWKAEAMLTYEEGNIDEPLYKPDGKYTQFTIPLKNSPNGKVISQGKVVSTFQKIKKFARNQVNNAGSGRIMWAVDLTLLEQNDDNIVVGVIVLYSTISQQVVINTPPQFPTGFQLQSCTPGNCISGTNTGGPDPLDDQIEERLNWTIPLEDQSNDIYINMGVHLIYSASSLYQDQQTGNIISFCQGQRLWCGNSGTSCLLTPVCNQFLNAAYFSVEEARLGIANLYDHEVAKVDMQHSQIWNSATQQYDWSHLQVIYVAERFTPNNPIGFD